MKKTIVALVLLMVLVLPLCFAACAEHNVITDDNLKANIIDDNYRTFYEIFVGGFSDSNGDGIGDLRGLINRLDYLNDGDPDSGKSLGITGIWLMPINFSLSYHKYDVLDYQTVDPKYGTTQDMKELIDECHRRGINVIIDLVLNHTSKQHRWFEAAQRARREGDVDNQYYDYYSVKIGSAGGAWYDFATDPQGNHWVYEGNFSSEMPELNYDNPLVKSEVDEIVKYWLVDMGIDGFRLDAVKYFYLNEDAKNIEFLKWLNQTCQSYKSDAYLVGENWSNQVSVINYYEAINCFDFSFSQVGGSVMAAVLYGGNSGSMFSGAVESYYNATKEKNPDSIMAPFLSNHDIDRIGGAVDIEQKTAQQAASLYLLMPGNPYIYYGEEIGMKGSRGSANTDANRRLAMLWGDGDSVKDPTGATYDPKGQTNGTVKGQLSNSQSLLNHYKKLIAIRNANPEIARGKVTAVTTFGENFAALRFEYNGSVVYVIHNLGTVSATLNVSSLGISTLRAWATEKSTLDGNTLTIGARGSVVLK